MPNIGLFSEIKNQATQINTPVNNILTTVYLALIFLRHPTGSPGFTAWQFEDRANKIYLRRF